MNESKNNEAFDDVEDELEAAPEIAPEEVFVASYETMIVPSGAPKTTVCILVNSYGNVRVGVSEHGEDAARDAALAS